MEKLNVCIYWMLVTKNVIRNKNNCEIKKKIYGNYSPEDFMKEFRKSKYSNNYYKFKNTFKKIYE